jgi:enamine deaminase RidA (YjgF/YER057c/UK114 family)
MLFKAAALTALILFAAPAAAQDISRTYTGPNAAIASVTRVPAGMELILLSGQVPDPAEPGGSTFGDTEAQTDSVIRKIERLLQAQGAGLGDVVSMTVYLVGDPAKGGRMDFDGMMRAYRRAFGTAGQPNRPSRSTVQVAGLVNPAYLVEIEVTAARR